MPHGERVPAIDIVGRCLLPLGLEGLVLWSTEREGEHLVLLFAGFSSLQELGRAVWKPAAMAND